MLFARLLESIIFDAILARGSENTLTTNAPVRIRRYSGGRFDWGRLSPETDELALNPLDWWFPYSVDEQVPDRRVFEQEFLVPAPHEGAMVKCRHAYLGCGAFLAKGVSYACQNAG